MPAIVLRHGALERNKRCLLAYLHGRASKICEMRWQFGPVLPSEIRTQLCEPEVSFFNRYNKDLAAYMRAIGEGSGVDLTTDQAPPKSLYIEVRCLKDYGEMETEDGTVIVLKKNTQHFLPRAQCEPLIRQGILEHV
jgi:GINS complex subunit 1